MITIDLRQKKHSVEELLTLAKSESVLLYGKDGEHFILEETDDFEKEVEALGKSEKFMKFLEGRSKEKDTISISTIAKRLGM
ncbi:hypothetical protein [Candidatus Thiosymbion oneisti]|uniref:hypothetical protein n=1 Tax=Candidatus Thiosymbion oneisti TaxID=589554 RepID=UPI001061B41F|nr:hypothetical protein [Candidatus Thiosymbion oneisti]